MKAVIDKPAASRNGIRQSIFHNWMSNHPALYQYIPQKIWFSFVQDLIKSQKSNDTRPVFAFLETYLPRLYEYKVSATDISVGMIHLRRLMLNQTFNDDEPSASQKLQRIQQVISIFDNILEQVGKAPQEPAATPPASTENLIENRLNTFFIEGNRFSGPCECSEPLKERLEKSGANWQPGEHPDWKSIIHKDDFYQLEQAFQQLPAVSSTMYEVQYRLKSGTDYYSVIELGRIHYRKNGEVFAFQGIIVPEGQKEHPRPNNAILRPLINRHEDIAILIDENGQAAWISSRLRALACRGDSKSLLPDADRPAPFYTGLSGENEIVARKFWETVSLGTKLPDPFTLVFFDQFGDATQPVSFHPFEIKRTFSRPFWLLLGQLPGSKIDAAYFEKNLRLLFNAVRGFNRMEDNTRFHQQLLEALEMLLPEADAAALLVRRDNCYYFVSGKGYKNSALRQQVIIDREGCRTIDQSAAAGERPDIAAPALSSQLSQNLFRYRAGKDFEEQQQHPDHLIGNIVANGKTRACVVVSRFRPGLRFPDSATTMLDLLLQISAGALERLNLEKQQQLPGPVAPDSREGERKPDHGKALNEFGQLAANLGHDFNNILGAIIPNAQMILKESDDELILKRAKAILVMAQRAATLAKQMTHYMVAKDLDEVRSVQLNILLEKARQLLTGLLGPEIRLSYQFDEDLPETAANPRQILQMIINLLNNSREAMPAGGQIDISTRLRQIDTIAPASGNLPCGDYVELAVQDSGPGIPAALQQEIFKPFFSTKEAAGGTGLGLAIVSGILKQLDGCILLESTPQNGTVFKILLPVLTVDKPTPNGIATSQEANRERQPAAMPAENSNDDSSDHPTQYVQGEGHILIVDDEKYLLDVLGSMAKFLGFNALEAASGEEALQLYRKHREKIRFVILDYGMPAMNGWQTLKRLRDEDPDLQVILCTGYAEQRDIRQMVRENHIHFLAKPFTIESLSEKIAAVTRLLPVHPPTSGN